MAGNERDKEKLYDYLVDGQKEIFNKLNDINDTLKQVAVQQNEISHLRTDLDETKDAIKEVKDIAKEDREAADLRFTEIEKACDKRHVAPRQTLLERVFHAVAIAIAVSAATAVFWLFLWIGYKNVNGFLQFKQDPGKQEEKI